MTRTDAREFMMTVAFRMDLTEGFDIDKEKVFLSEKETGKQTQYCETCFSLLCNKLNNIDDMILSYCRGWMPERMPKTDLAILRIAVCEMIYMDDIPDSVSINEAVEMAKKFGDDDSPKYINGILSSIEKNLRASDNA